MSLHSYNLYERGQGLKWKGPVDAIAEGAVERNQLLGGLTKAQLQLFLICAKCCFSAYSVNTLGFVNTFCGFLFLCHVPSWVVPEQMLRAAKTQLVLCSSGLCLSLEVGKSGAVHGLGLH